MTSCHFIFLENNGEPCNFRSAEYRSQFYYYLPKMSYLQFDVSGFEFEGIWQPHGCLPRARPIEFKNNQTQKNELRLPHYLRQYSCAT